jgi:hypothetical protein
MISGCLSSSFISCTPFSTLHFFLLCVLLLSCNSSEFSAAFTAKHSARYDTTVNFPYRTKREIVTVHYKIPIGTHLQKNSVFVSNQVARR